MRYRVLEITPKIDGSFDLPDHQRLVHVLHYKPGRTYKDCGEEWVDEDASLVLLVQEAA